MCQRFFGRTKTAGGHSDDIDRTLAGRGTARDDQTYDLRVRMGRCNVIVDARYRNRGYGSRPAVVLGTRLFRTGSRTSGSDLVSCLVPSRGPGPGELASSLVHVRPTNSLLLEQIGRRHQIGTQHTHCATTRRRSNGDARSGCQTTDAGVADVGRLFPRGRGYARTSQGRGRSGRSNGDATGVDRRVRRC